MYLCSSDVLPTFMSPRSTIFPSGFLILPQEVPLLLPARVRPVRAGRRWSSRSPPPPPECRTPGLARTQTRGNPDSRRPGLAGSRNLRGPAGTLRLRRLGARKRKWVSQPGQDRRAQPSAHLGCPERGGRRPGRPRARLPWPRPMPLASPEPRPAPTSPAPPLPLAPARDGGLSPAGRAGGGRVARAARARAPRHRGGVGSPRRRRPEEHRCGPASPVNGERALLGRVLPRARSRSCRFLPNAEKFGAKTCLCQSQRCRQNLSFPFPVGLERCRNGRRVVWCSVWRKRRGESVLVRILLGGSAEAAVCAGGPRGEAWGTRALALTGADVGRITLVRSRPHRPFLSPARSVSTPGCPALPARSPLCALPAPTRCPGVWESSPAACSLGPGPAQFSYRDLE